MNPTEQRSIAEAVILASPEPIPAARLASVIPSCNPAQARALAPMPAPIRSRSPIHPA